MASSRDYKFIGLLEITSSLGFFSGLQVHGLLLEITSSLGFLSRLQVNWFSSRDYKFTGLLLKITNSLGFFSRLQVHWFSSRDYKFTGLLLEITSSPGCFSGLYYALRASWSNSSSVLFQSAKLFISLNDGFKSASLNSFKKLKNYFYNKY